MGLFRSKKEKKFKNMTLNEFITLFSAAQSSSGGEPMNLSGVYNCVEMMSNTMSKLPLFVMDNNTKKHIDDDNLYKVLNIQPNQNMNATVYKKLIETWRLIYGNAYVLPVRKGLKLTELLPIHPSCVDIFKKNSNVLYRVNLNGTTYIFRPDEICHLKAYTLDGIKGISPLEYARIVLNVGLNQENFQQDFYSNGGRPSGVLKTEADLSSKKVKRGDKEVSYKEILQEEWSKTSAGNKKAFYTAILDNGLNYQTIQQISPADMDFVNSKTVNLEDIARFFNIPPYKLGVGKQTYSSNEQASIDYITNSIIPVLYQYENEYTLKVLLNNERSKGWVIKGNIEAEMRGDTSTRANWYDKMRSMGVYSINEIRALENLPDIENGDARLIGANSTPLERLLKGETVQQIVSGTTDKTEGNK